MAAKTTKKENKKSSVKKKAVTRKPVAKKTVAVKAKKTHTIKKVVDSPKVNIVPEPVSVKPNNRVSPKMLYVAAIIIGLGGLLYLGKGLVVAAMVNGYPITRFELVKTLEKDSGKQTLDNLITKSLIFQEANKQGVTVTDQDINDEITKISESLKSQNTTLEDALAMQGESMDALRESIKLQKMVEKMFGNDIQISDEEVKKYYDENKTYFADKKLVDIQEDIKTQLIQQKISDNYRNWLTKAKTDAKVQYFVNL